MQSLTVRGVLGLVLSLWVENTDLVQETFKLSRSWPMLLVAMWLLYVSYGVVRLPLLVITLRSAGLI
jgi:hypothetical protein